MKERLYRFMMGRYGVDKLNRHLSMLALVLAIISVFKRYIVFTILVDALLIIVLLRMFSKNINKRYQENVRYEQMISSFTKEYNFIKRKHNDKDHRYYKCPQCKQVVRVPRGRGKIEITCPKCHHQFEKKS